VPISSGAQGSTALLQYLGNGVWGLVSGSASGSSVAVVNQGTGVNGSGAVGSSSGLATALVTALAGQPPTIGGSASKVSDTSVAQELVRRLAARDADVAQLRADKDALAVKVALLQAREQDREARLARLESRLNENATGAVRTTLERK